MYFIWKRPIQFSKAAIVFSSESTDYSILGKRKMSCLTCTQKRNPANVNWLSGY